MISDIHISDFYRDSALVLKLLFQQFPRKTTIWVEDVSGPDNPDEFGLHSARYTACFSTMLWLEAEKHIRFDSIIRQDAIDQAELSQPAFFALSRHRVDDSGDLYTLISKFDEALRENSSKLYELAMREYIQDFV